VSPALEKLGFDHDVTGGGRIEHKKAEKSIHVYGYSQVGESHTSFVVPGDLASEAHCRPSGERTMP
jgi:hypothetical protein